MFGGGGGAVRVAHLWYKGGGLITGLKKSVSKQGTVYIGVMIKILFEFDCLFTRQDDVICKKSNSFLSGGLITGFIKFSASDNAFLAFCLVRSISVISSYTLVWPYMENTYVEETKFLLDKVVVNLSRFCELSANETTKKLENAILVSTKKPWGRGYSLL